MNYSKLWGYIIDYKERLFNMLEFTLKVSRIFLFFIFAVFMCIINPGESFANNATIKIDDVEGEKGDIKEVPLIIEDSDGMAGGKIVVEYDPDKIEVKEANRGDVLEGAYFEPNIDYAEDKVAIVWAAIREVQDDGTVAELKVELNDTGESVLSMSEISLTDVQGNEISAEGTEGKVSIGNDIEEDPDEEPDDIEDPEEADEEDINDEEEPSEEDIDPDEKEEEDPEKDDEKEEEEVEKDEEMEPSLKITDVEGELEDVVEVAVKGENIEGLSGNLVISYDSDMVEAVEIVDALPENYIMESNLEYDEDSIALAWFQVEESDGGDYEKDIARISFQLLEDGVSELEFSQIMLVDADGEEVALETTSGTIICGEEGFQLLGENGNFVIYIILVVIAVIVVGLLVFRKIKANKKDEEFFDFE